MTPVLGIYYLIESPFCTTAQSDWPPLYVEKISLSLSHLVPEILGPNVALIFTKIYYLTDFKHFASIFSLIFDPIEPPFQWFEIFLIPHFHKTYLLPKIWWSTPAPTPSILTQQLHNHDIVSVHFNNFYCTELCDKLSRDFAMLTYIYLNVDDC